MLVITNLRTYEFTNLRTRPFFHYSKSFREVKHPPANEEGLFFRSSVFQFFSSLVWEGGANVEIWIEDWPLANLIC